MSARMLAPTGRRAAGPSGAPGGAHAGTAAEPSVSGRARAVAGPAGGTVLHIDWTACDGRGLCTELLPDLLLRDDWGYPLALGYGSDVPVPGHLTAAAADAVALCPRQALTLSRTVS